MPRADRAVPTLPCRRSVRSQLSAWSSAVWAKGIAVAARPTTSAASPLRAAGLGTTSSDAAVSADSMNTPSGGTGGFQQERARTWPKDRPPTGGWALSPAGGGPRATRARVTWWGTVTCSLSSRPSSPISPWRSATTLWRWIVSRFSWRASRNASSPMLAELLDGQADHLAHAVLHEARVHVRALDHLDLVAALHQLVDLRAHRALDDAQQRLGLDAARRSPRGSPRAAGRCRAGCGWPPARR